MNNIKTLSINSLNWKDYKKNLEEMCKLSEKDNKLYSAFIKVMNDNADLFAESLLNLILKSKFINLPKEHIY